MHTLSECCISELLYLCTIQSNALIQFNSSNNYEFDTILACLGPDSGDGNGIIRFLAIQTPEEKRVCDVLLHFPQHILVHHVALSHLNGRISSRNRCHLLLPPVSGSLDQHHTFPLSVQAYKA